MNGLMEMIIGILGCRFPFAGKCPVCGSAKVKSKVRQPMGPIVKDGPTIVEMKCRKCGYRWSVPLRVGP